MPEILAEAFEEYLVFEVPEDYVTVEANEAFATATDGDGTVLTVETVPDSEAIGAEIAYLSVGTSAPADVEASGSIDVVETSSTFDVVTIGEVTNNFNYYDGAGGQFVCVSTTQVTADMFATYLCNSVGGAFSIPLPEGAEEGDWVAFWDDGDAFDTNPVTVELGGYTSIEGEAEDLVLNCSTRGVIMVYKGGDWSVFKDGRLGDYENVIAEITTVEGTTNVFFSETQPAETPPFVWYELDNAGNLADWHVVLP